MIQLEPNKWRFTFFFGDYNGDFEENFIATIQEHLKFVRSAMTVAQAQWMQQFSERNIRMFAPS